MLTETSQPLFEPRRRSGHSAARMEKIAESRSRPSSPGAQERDQPRRTPSNRAPTASIAARERLLRASVFRSTRATPQFSNAWRNSSSLDSLFSPVPWTEGASQVKPTSTAHSSSGSRSGHSLGSKKPVAPTARPVDSATCAYGATRPVAARACCASMYCPTSAALGTQVNPYEARSSSAATARSAA